MIRWALITTAGSGLAAVIIGASGAHAVGDLPGNAATFFDIAGRYHFVHTLALAVGAVAPAAGAHRRACAVACAAWLAGILLFCGSLYALALVPSPYIGAVTPFGGIALIGGWLALLVAAARRN